MVLRVLVAYNKLSATETNNENTEVCTTLKPGRSTPALPLDDPDAAEVPAEELEAPVEPVDLAESAELEAPAVFEAEPDPELDALEDPLEELSAEAEEPTKDEVAVALPDEPVAFAEPDAEP